ncbi:hypothetical protein SHXM_06867 [Streptomyces hygroscopicus]|nr:hypothetical protein SHXM_06867 [Streptomyces hygroscopicus]
MSRWRFPRRFHRRVRGRPWMRRPRAGHHRRPGPRRAGCWRGRLYIGTAKHPDLPGQWRRAWAVYACCCSLGCRTVVDAFSLRDSCAAWVVYGTVGGWGGSGQEHLASGSFGAAPGVRAGCCAPTPVRVVAGPGVLAACRPGSRCREVWAAGAVGERRGSGVLGGVPRASRWSRLCTRCGGARPRILEHLLLCASVPPRWTGSGSVMARVRGALAPQVRVPEVQWGADPLPGGGKDPLLESLLIMSAPVGRYRRTRHHAWGFPMNSVRDIRRRDIPCPAPGRQPSPQSGAAPVPEEVWGVQARQWLGSGCRDGDEVLGVRVDVHVRQRAAGERS